MKTLRYIHSGKNPLVGVPAMLFVTAIVVATLLLSTGTVHAAEPQQANVELTVALTGAAEIPGPGDDDGTGTAVLTFDFTANQVCYTLETANIAEPSAGHIHIGAADASGGVALALFGDAAGAANGCADTDAATMNSILADPTGHYVNIHNAEFGAGAIRGQLVSGTTLMVQLSGNNEVPGPGDDDGLGTATLTMDASSNVICYTLATQNIAEPTAGHIHEGASGESGGVAVALFADPANAASGCVNTDADTFSLIENTLTGYYINIHNLDFPAGAIRGQLSSDTPTALDVTEEPVIHSCYLPLIAIQ
ncbi:MAG: CHRD domain-containing protein [Chloroflexota bacterium]